MAQKTEPAAPPQNGSMVQMRTFDLTPEEVAFIDAVCQQVQLPTAELKIIAAGLQQKIAG